MAQPSSELIAFVSNSLRQVMTTGQVVDVLTNVVRSPEYIIDLSDSKVGRCVGVLIDTCQSYGNAAELTVCFEPSACGKLDFVIEKSLSLLKTSPRTNLDLPQHQGMPFPRDFLEKHAFSDCYHMYNMRAERLLLSDELPLPEGWNWSSYEDRFAPELHDVLSRAFAEVPGAFIAPLESFRLRWASAEPKAQILWHGAKLVGFVRIERNTDGKGELRILGRDPMYRGQAIGLHLVRRDIELLLEFTAAPFYLEVAAENERALSLYRRFGFEIAHDMTVFRKALS